MPSRRRGKPSSRHRPSKAAPAAPAQIPPVAMKDALAAREFFWSNVVREVLVSLASASMSSTTPEPGQSTPQSTAASQIFDGRVAIITKDGTRIGIAGITPVFAAGSSKDRSLSMLVECTVFQIRTPEGEVWTLPLHEIAAVHSISEELLAELRQAGASANGTPDNAQPFGFAAFTSMARLGRPPEKTTPETDFLGE